MLEKAYNRSIPFMQAQMFNQMPNLRNQIDINVNSIIDDYTEMRVEELKKQSFTRLVMYLGLVGVILHFSWITLVSGVGIGTLTIIIGAARTFQGNLESIVSIIAEQWNSAKGVILIEKDFFGLKSTIKTESPVIPTFKGIPKITFDHVSFSYLGSETEAVKDVSFTIEPGSKVAIVGKSGNGKSTLQALLMRQYDPSSGTIYADDVNLKNIEPVEWSKFASALTQEYVVLERTVAEEIASSVSDQPVNMEGVIESAEFAHFDEVLKDDPKGYNTQIGVEFGGRDFSGGEKQRLALARVHYRGTPILILDEPDAKLDPDSAKKVIDQVFALKNVTVVMITHHVSRAERCDKVIMMGKGRIVEQGTPHELMAKKGPYAAMYRDDKDRLEGKKS
jgi:ABC-type multidrug transport system fused ATPase/permease subunit